MISSIDVIIISAYERPARYKPPLRMIRFGNFTHDIKFLLGVHSVFPFFCTNGVFTVFTFFFQVGIVGIVGIPTS